MEERTTGLNLNNGRSRQVVPAEGELRDTPSMSSIENESPFPHPLAHLNCVHKPYYSLPEWFVAAQRWVRLYNLESCVANLARGGHTDPPPIHTPILRHPGKNSGGGLGGRSPPLLTNSEDKPPTHIQLQRNTRSCCSCRSISWQDHKSWHFQKRTHATQRNILFSVSRKGVRCLRVAEPQPASLKQTKVPRARVLHRTQLLPRAITVGFGYVCVGTPPEQLQCPSPASGM